MPGDAQPVPVPIPSPPGEAREHVAAVALAGLNRTPFVPATAWILYDLANTVYAATLTFVFFPWLGEHFHTRTLQGVVNSASMVAAGLCVPVFAALADRTGRCRGYLVFATLVCIGAMACFGLSESAAPLMAAFFVANFTYNASLVFYNALLPSVAADKSQGLVSGFGVGLGYLGTILTLVIMLKAQAVGEAIGFPLDHGRTMILLAGLFLVFALPSFFLVRERRNTPKEAFSGALVRRQARQVLQTLKGLPKDRAVMWFLLGNFFCVDVLNTAIAFFGDLTMKTFAEPIAAGEVTLFGFTISEPKELAFVAGLALNLLALVFGVTLGFLTDRLGSLRVLRFSALCLVGGLTGAAFTLGQSALGYVVAICGLGGLGLSGIWTAGRKLLIDLSPRDRVGEYFGLYGITTKLSVLGSAIFGILKDQVTRLSGDDLLGWQVALGAQVVPLTLGLIFLAKVKVRPRTGSPTGS